MELFSLLAKLTLDTKEYEKALSQARTGANIELQDPRLGLDTSEFDEGIRDAENTEVDDPADPELGLNTTDFDAAVTDAESTDVDDPTEPELGLDTSEFQSGVSEAEELGAGFGETMKGVFEDIKGALAAAGITGALVGVINFLKQGINLAKDHGDAIDKQSQKLKVSTKTYQELDYALTLSGASITDMTRAMRTFTEISGGKATDDQVAAFEALGISATDASGKMKSAEQLMEESLYALADYGGADRGILQEALFGRNSAGLNALLNAGSEGIKEMRQEANDLGLVMTDEEVKNAAAYMDATTRLEKSLQGLQEAFAADILPLLTSATNEVAKIVALFNWRTGDNDFSGILERIDEEGADALLSLKQNEAQADSLIDKLADMGSYWTLDDQGKKTWDTLASELIKLFPELDKVIDDNRDAFYENRDAIKANIDEYTKLEQQRILDQNLAQKREAIAKQYAAALDKEVEAELKETEAEGKKVVAFAKLEDYFNTGAGKAYLEYLQGRFGYTGTMDEEMYNQIGSGWISTLLSESGYRDTETSAALKDWKDTEDQITSLREESEKMTQEADAASETYTKYAEKLSEKLGVTLTDTEEATKAAAELRDTINQIPDYKRITIMEEKMGFQQAKGNWDVPYDNYPSLLHRGEMVLTASDARRYREGTRDADMTDLEDRIIKAIQAGMENAKVSTYLNGKDITDEVSRELTQQASARRFR